MKTNRLLNIAKVAICAVALGFATACEGPMGPAGPIGPEGAVGAAGADGSDGTPGVSGTAECLACHSLDTKYRVTQEYNGSVHSEGVAMAYAGGRAGCAMCHSNEGFIETQWSGLDAAEHDFAFPTRISCTTCHAWHNEGFDLPNDPDYALRTTDPVELLMFRAYDLPVQTVDMGDNSNLCVNCHQPRRSWEGYFASDDNLGTTYDQGSTHFGPHHGSQGTTFAGIGGADVGTTAMPTTTHIHGTLASCTACHMDEQNHSFEPRLDGCNTASCHDGAITTLDENPRQLAVKTKYEQLETALVTAGLLEIDPVDLTVGQVKGIFPVDHVGALYNYEWVHADRSMGVHNFTMIEALLDKSLEAML